NDNHISAHEQIDYFKQISTEQKIPDKLIIPSIEGFHFTNFHEILYCFAVSNYTEFHLLGNKKILSSYTLGYYDELLKDHGFFRIHRSYLINLSHIKMYRRGDGGTVIMENDEEIEVSRNKKESFLKILKS
ncbi:MAG: LytTR family transcriptional regulator DNA-binding domain-containing protein, partial [Chitinophagaceae bacterium]|nr:LytTR family transcriptional regulator DNA-binding domain-containing protein [Chitinophagaceae bacterium]